MELIYTYHNPELRDYGLFSAKDTKYFSLISFSDHLKIYFGQQYYDPTG